MVDTHYDLLTIAYKAYLTGNYSYIEKISKYFTDHNVTCVFANLYFMSLDEMKEEICEEYYKDGVSVLEMFEKAKQVLDIFLPETEILYSIEGADFIDGPEELEKLYDAGLDALILCWDTENKYGSGKRSDKGLTNDGCNLINKAIDLGLGIDLSHANKNTFYDICDLIENRKKSGIDVCCYASHSNARSICDRERNLDDDQLRRLHDIGALVGIFANKNFIVDPSKTEDLVNLKEEYLKHVGHVKNIVGVEHTMVATDDMGFCADADPVYGTLAIYDYGSIKKTLFLDLLDEFGGEAAIAMIYKNAKRKIYDHIKNKRNQKMRGVK